MTGQAMPNYTEDPMLINFPSSNDTDLLVLKPMVVNLGKDLFRNGRNTQLNHEGGLKKTQIFLKTKYILANLFKNTFLSMSWKHSELNITFKSEVSQNFKTYNLSKNYCEQLKNQLNVN